ncbi:hypothetical protein G7054_g10763 [Neopestalotiopsis clavispora]|nr:hypothetical protein G7054_g10763 [Neopestalotiopsis clavispora]
MPSVQQVTSRVRRDDAASSHAAILSRPAIIGIALGGSFVLFLALSHLFIVLGRRRDRQRLAALQAHTHAVRSPVAHLGHQPDSHHRAWLSSPFVDPYDSDIPVGGAGGKNRLRKKTVLLSKYVAAAGSDRDMTDRSKNWTSHQGIALPVLPPVFSRQQSYNLNPFLSSGPESSNDGCSSTRGRDDDFERVEHQRIEKQRGREMYQMRRRGSWIDEDALHGPKVSPQKKQKKIKEENGNRMSKGGKGKMSWLLAGSLTRRLSLKRPLSDSAVFGSPTLPHMEQPTVAVELGAAAEDRGRSRQRRPASMSHADAGATTPPRVNSQDSPLKPGQYNTVRIAIPSAISAPILPVPKPPAAMINNPRHRNSVGLDAAQLLASNAKVSNGQQQRPSLPKHSATDSELSEILRMTTERLQDGKRSSRRQTMLIRSKTGDLESVYHEHSNTMNLLTVDSRTTSPTKSQKSAPAVLCAELESNEVSPTKPQNNPQELQQVTTPSRRSQQHHLHQQHSRQLSQMSLASEADSMITMRAMSQTDEHTTALSSPSRNVKIAAEPIPRREDTPLRQQQQQPTRPYSAASSNSSALSTLYSEDEGNMAAGPGLQYNAKRGTLGQVTFLPPPRPLTIAKSDDTDKRRSTVTGSGGLVKAWLPRETSLHFTIYAMDEEPDDPFTTTKTTPDPVRLSQVFTPIPPSSSFNNELDDNSSHADEEEDAASSFKGWSSEMLTQYPTVRVTRPSSNKEKSTPTPSPKNNRIRPPTIVLPPPTIQQQQQQQQQGALRPMTSSPTLGAGLSHGRPSPVMSEGGLSSVYESYASSEGGGASLNYSTATLSTVPTNESVRSQGGDGTLGGQPVPGGRAEGTFISRQYAPEAKPARPHVERLISVDSVYSQDQDQQERGNNNSRQQGIGLGLRLGLRGDLPEKQPGTRLQRNQYNHDQGGNDEDDTVSALANTSAPTLNPQRTSYVLAHTVAELRRMNSSVSAASGASSVATTTTSTFTEGGETGSPTLPAMRGGGFSPGKRTSGTRSYLAVGSPPKRRSVQQQQQQLRPLSQFGNVTATGEVATAAEAPRGSGLARSGARSRRGTMSSACGNVTDRLPELSKGGVLREGSGGNLGGREGGKIMDKERLHVISAGAAAGTSSESLGLYDDKGFLRSSPIGRG